MIFSSPENAPEHMNKILVALLGSYYILFVAKIVTPLIPIGSSWMIGLLFSAIVLYASPVAVVTIILICLSPYISYKKYGTRPSIIFIIILVTLSILPVIFTSQIIQSIIQQRQLSVQTAAIYTDKIPASTNTQLYTPNNTIQNLIGGDFEPYFTEAKKDGTYFIAIYKKRNEKANNSGQSIGSYLKDPNSRGVIFYPDTYIQFYGETTGYDPRKIGVTECPAPASIMNIYGLTDGLNGIKTVYEESVGDTKLTVYQLKDGPWYKSNIRKGDSCSVIDFFYIDYSKEKIIEISKSLMRQ